MPVEFRLEPTGSSSDTTRLVMMYDGSGRRISKTILSKSAAATSWDTVKVTHYTGIGTEIREEFHNGSRERVSVVVNMPQGLGRYKVADASQPADDNASRTFEWYLKNHLGSTMLVYGTVASTDPNNADIGETKAAYDYRAFGEMVTLSQPSDKVTENFTGKEHDEEIKLNYFGARYLDPMLGMWISVDPKRQVASPYLYAGKGMNPIIGDDSDGNWFNPLGLFVGVGVGIVESWNAQAEYRRVSGENYNPVTESIIGALVYGSYVVAGAVGVSGGVAKSVALSGLIGGGLSSGSVALAEIAGSENFEGVDGDKITQCFTKGALSSMVGAAVGAGATEMMGGTMSEIYGKPSFQEVLGGAIGGLVGFEFDRNATLEWDKKDSAE